ncbi:E3 ubiquitin-protein ligase RMND5A-like isoform X2 [Artemia franciscana]|uniref:Uncharacterized protein n=1 Tax=Artemia franciscana TaxID=6661 RepID=A0AA88L534_ARTSF|nr:hypothetical protein QYM36_011691 [Artemia franciscana]
MESINAVDKELDRVLGKFTALKNHGLRTVGDLETQLLSLKNELQSAPPESKLTFGQISILSQVMTKVKEATSRIATEHRELHGTVSKVGKSIDKNFVPDYDSVVSDKEFRTDEKMKILDKVICNHFFRSGQVEVGEELAKEAGLAFDVKSKEPFQEINQILEHLKGGNVQSALAWCDRHKDKLHEMGSSLEFKLHRLCFISLIQEGPSRQKDALTYARIYLPKFAGTHQKEFQSLMATLLYVSHGMDQSPYRHLLDPFLWADVSETFMRDACTLLGLSIDSPLAVCVNAGCVTLPALLSIKQVMMQRQVQGMWTSKDELPIEVDLGTKCRFHSIFACPILRQQSTESNPPTRLVCGHAISKDALARLSNSRFKCPYCPMEQNPADARQIYF